MKHAQVVVNPTSTFNTSPAQSRSLHAIAQEIKAHMRVALRKAPPKVPGWVQFSMPYVNAMRELNTIEERYYLDSAYEIVLRARCNLANWRGVDAKRIKAELDAILKSCPEDKHL